MREKIGVYLFPLNSLVSVAMRSACCVCLWKHLSVCVVIIEAHLLLWESADVSLWLQCGLMPKGVYCFITHKRCCGKGGVTVPLKPEPSSDLFVDLWGETQNNEQFYLFPFSPLFYSHLISTRGKVCWSRMLFVPTTSCFTFMEVCGCSV